VIGVGAFGVAEVGDDVGRQARDKRQYLRQRDRAKAELAEAEARQAEAGRGSVLAPFESSQDVAEVWEALDLDRRRAVVDALAVARLHPTGRGVSGGDPGGAIPHGTEGGSSTTTASRPASKASSCAALTPSPTRTATVTGAVGVWAGPVSSKPSVDVVPTGTRVS
jgi:hypothetical protein